MIDDSENNWFITGLLLVLVVGLLVEMGLIPIAISAAVVSVICFVRSYEVQS